ncbi:MAG: molybdenum cofactor biosynthesis protein MoaE [Gammaproteobacteria bacterium]
MISIQTEDFDLGREQAELRIAAGDAGAIVTFTGLVREVYDQTASDGGSESKHDSVVALTLEHYPGMTEKCLQDIADQANARWRLLATRIIHRVGRLQAQDQIVLVATASAHRQDAFDAAQFIMDYLKSNAPFWKKQETPNGSEWVDSRQSDDDAIARWQKSC